MQKFKHLIATTISNVHEILISISNLDFCSSNQMQAQNGD